MNDTYKKIFIYIYTVLILASLNVNPNTFFSDSVDGSVRILNIFRFIFPSLMLIIFIILNKKKLFIVLSNNNSVNSKLVALFFLILLTFSLTKNFFVVENLYFILYLNIFAYTYILSNYYKPQSLFKNFILILVVYFSYWSLNIVYDFYNYNNSLFSNLFNLRNTNSHQLDDIHFLGNPNLNSNGAARVLSIISLTIYSYQLFFKKKYLNYLCLLVLIFLIYSLQSRFAFYALFLAFLLLIIINNKNKFRELLIISIFFISPLLVQNILIVNKSNIRNQNNYSQSEIKNRLTLESNEVISVESYDDMKKSFVKLGFSEDTTNSLISLNKITTGRLEIWINYLIFKNKTNYFFGHGILSDKKFFSISISNALLYAYFTTGILGSLVYLTICTIFLINFIKYKTHNREYDMRIIFYIVTFFLLLRSIIENGFLTYGLDLILILICFESINKKKLDFYKF
jgi:hypothetical protein